MPKLNTGFSRLGEDDPYHFALQVVARVGANPKFAGLSAQLPPIFVAAQALDMATTLARRGGTRSGRDIRAGKITTCKSGPRPPARTTAPGGTSRARW